MRVKIRSVFRTGLGIQQNSEPQWTGTQRPAQVFPEPLFNTMSNCPPRS